MASYTTDQKVFVIKTIYSSACSYIDVEGKHRRDFYVLVVSSEGIEDTPDCPAVALLTPSRYLPKIVDLCFVHKQRRVITIDLPSSGA
jgi:hypothetical protein